MQLYCLRNADVGHAEIPEGNAAVVRARARELVAPVPIFSSETVRARAGYTSETPGANRRIVSQPICVRSHRRAHLPVRSLRYNYGRSLRSFVRYLRNNSSGELRERQRSGRRMKSDRVGIGRLRFTQPRILIALISQIGLYREGKKRR